MNHCLQAQKGFYKSDAAEKIFVLKQSVIKGTIVLSITDVSPRMCFLARATCPSRSSSILRNSNNPTPTLRVTRESDAMHLAEAIATNT
ncbi:hypothetical protein C0J52_26998 [Blattella germanica]|nr:hypothetical protein C0J52_26998 [Blattella germanica]